jgi:hypothetical protein
MLLTPTRNRTGANMTKRYSTTYSNGHTEETSSAVDANHFQNYDEAQTFRLSGKDVSAAEFFFSTRTAMQAAWDKKAETHKRVRVLYGSSAACYVEKWIRK